MPITRRVAMLATVAACASAPGSASGADALELGWEDLVPNGGGARYDQLRALGVVRHGDLDGLFVQETDAPLTNAFDGKRVTLPGFVIPLEFAGTRVTTIILALYVGACIHVPPPPPKKLVLVTAEDTYLVRALFDPVVVTGLFRTAAVDAGLAELGYVLEAERIERFGFWTPLKMRPSPDGAYP